MSVQTRPAIIGAVTTQQQKHSHSLSAATAQAYSKHACGATTQQEVRVHCNTTAAAHSLPTVCADLTWGRVWCHTPAGTTRSLPHSSSTPEPLAPHLRSSVVPRPSRKYTFTGSCWPCRCARSSACCTTATSEGSSANTTLLAALKSSPVPATGHCQAGDGDAGSAWRLH